jgi:hypothetical protein
MGLLRERSHPRDEANLNSGDSMTNRFFHCLAALLVVAAPELRAQDASALGAGVRVRLVTPTIEANQQMGKVVTATSDTIVFRSDANPITRSIPVADIASLDISGGMQTHRGRDALYGLLIGGGAGAIAGAASYKKPAPGCWVFCETRSADTFAGGLAGGLVGTLIGAFVVGSFDKTERWIPLRRMARPFLGAGPAGIRVGLSRFF